MAKLFKRVYEASGEFPEFVYYILFPDDFSFETSLLEIFPPTDTVLDVELDEVVVPPNADKYSDGSRAWFEVIVLQANSPVTDTIYLDNLEEKL